MDEKAEKKIADLERELAGVQQMLGSVLKVTGQVIVPKEQLKLLDDTQQIVINDDQEKDAFVFELVKVSE